jgi:hypothetical protein
MRTPGQVRGRLVGLAALAALAWPGVGPGAAPVPLPPVAASSPSFSAVAAEHRYRIIGKLRLGLFNITRDDVGTARIAWRADGPTSVLTLLVGSDPSRAPRGVNQWGYLREETHRADAGAQVFSLRSLDGDDLGPDAAFGLGNGPLFGASCSAFHALEVNSVQTTVKAKGVTYRMFNQLLETLPAASSWTERRLLRPAGSDAGFLTALQNAMARTDRGGPQARPTITYMYNGTIYDLTVRGSEALGSTRVGARLFDRLTRSDFAIRNRTTGDVTKFGVTHVPAQAGMPLPVQIFYRPNLWLSVELRLDADADVPPDPETDGSVLRRIRSICGSDAELAR